MFLKFISIPYISETKNYENPWKMFSIILKDYFFEEGWKDYLFFSFLPKRIPQDGLKPQSKKVELPIVVHHLKRRKQIFFGLSK